MLTFLSLSLLVLAALALGGVLLIPVMILGLVWKLFRLVGPRTRTA